MSYSKQSRIFGLWKTPLKNISEEIYGDIEKITGKIVKKFKEDIATRTGQLLHNLQNDKPDKNALRALIQEFPASLEYKNDKGQLPIQSAVWNRKSVGYIPILAEKGNEYDVGGDDKRGGLLLWDLYDRNVLQLLAEDRS